MISKDFDILKKQTPGHVISGIRHLFFGFDSETVIGDDFTRFANPISVSFVKQAVSLKPKLEPVSVSTNGSRPKTRDDDNDRIPGKLHLNFLGE